MMNPRKTALLLAIVVGLLANAALSQGNREEAERKRLLDNYSDMEGVILFYGKVADQQGNPVEGASVDVSVPTVNMLGNMSYAKKTLQTDREGRFEVSGRTYGTPRLVGLYLDVDRISKDGYAGDWIRGINRTFSFSTSDAKRFVPNASRPIVYMLRKKGDLTFLLHETDLDLEMSANKSGDLLGYDLVRRHRISDIGKLSFNGEPVFPDLLVKATFNGNDGAWTVVLSPGNTNGGIMVSEELLYEAPETGYRPDYTFTPDDGKPVKAKYVYLKSRDPAIYTRYVIELVNANKEFFRLSGKSETNPYGDRNLEQATDLPYAVTERLADEVEAAFRQNKRPTKPDLPRLVKEANEKAGKAKDGH